MTTFARVALALLLGCLSAATLSATELSINSGRIIYQKGDEPLVLDRNASLTTTSTDLDSGQLEVSIVTLLEDDDLLSVVAGDYDEQLTRLTVVGQTIRAQDIDLSGSSRTYGPTVTIATWQGGAGTTLKFLFSREATPVRVTALLRAIAYSNTDSVSPVTGERAIHFILVDLDDSSSPVEDDTYVRVVNFNSPPTVEAGAATTLEDVDLTGSLADRWVDDDSSGTSITYYLSGTPVGGEMVSLNRNTGAFVFRPAANFNGTASFQFLVKDERSSSGVATFTITTTAVNDSPTFTPGANVTVDEDSGTKTVNDWATVIAAGPADEASQTVTFVVSATNPSLFSTAPAISAAGRLTFTPAPNANGSSTVSVTLTDNGGTANDGSNTSTTITFTVIVRPVNDSPVPTNTSVNSVIGARWTGTVLVTDVDSTIYTFTVTGISHLGELSVDPVTGSIIFDPQTAGDEVVPVTVSDGSNTVESTISIHVSDFGPGRPRIISTPPVEVADAGSAWEYDVIVSPQTVEANGVLTARLQGLSGGTITKVSGNRFRITYAVPANGNGYIRFGVVVSDTVNNKSDYQGIVLRILPTPGGAG